MAYVLGFFAADGTLTVHYSGTEYIAFHVTDLELLEAIRRLMGSDHKIAVRTRDIRWKLGYRLQIGNSTLAKDLRALGFTPNKSKTLVLPEIPIELVGEYVRGYFDGDGCVYFNVLQVAGRRKPKPILQTRFTCGCKKYLESLLDLLRRNGIAGGFIVTKTNGAFELILSHKDSLAIYRLMYNNAETCGVFLERKKEKFDHAIQHMYAGVAQLVRALPCHGRG